MDEDYISSHVNVKTNKKMARNSFASSWFVDVKK